MNMSNFHSPPNQVNALEGELGGGGDADGEVATIAAKIRGTAKASHMHRVQGSMIDMMGGSGDDEVSDG